MSVGEPEGYVPLIRCCLSRRTAPRSALLYARSRLLADTASTLTVTQTFQELTNVLKVPSEQSGALGRAQYGSTNKV